MQIMLKQLLRTHKDKIPETAIGMVVTLSKMDDGGHMAECEQMVRDLRIYPALEAALLAYSYLPHDNALAFADAIIEYLGLSEKPFCECCGTRESSAFGTNKKLCLGCIAGGIQLEECAVCGASGYEGDTFCALLVDNDEMAETFSGLGFMDVKVGDRLTPEMVDTFATASSLDAAVRAGMLRESWDTCEGATWICQRCLDKGKGPENVIEY